MTGFGPAHDPVSWRPVSRRLREFCVLSLVALLGAMGAAPAVPVPPGETDGTSGFFPVDEIHPGLRGTAHTVFEGSVVEEIGVEFLGVLKNAIGPQQDLILARLRGERIEFTGVISGMSGSPVYVDGRLVGAVSYRIGQFAKEPIAGITPIADMVAAVDAGRPLTGVARVPAPDLLGRFLSGTRPLSAADGESGVGPPGSAGAMSVVTSGAAGMRPISTPLVCSGCDPAVLQYYAPIFLTQGLEPTAGGGSVATTDLPLPFTPGTAIGAALVTGDASLAGIGTLTYLDGNRAFAFGHPFLGMGSTQIPMTQAQVLLTFASNAGSFRIANATAPIGTLMEDRLTAIVGEVGPVPPMLPLKVRVESVGGTREFNYEIVRDRAWAPVVMALITSNSLVRTTEYNVRSSLELQYRIDIEGFPAVTMEDLYAGTNPGQPVHFTLANEAAGLFALLYNNPFQDLPVVSVEAVVRVLEKFQVARIVSLRVSASEVRPGESFTVTAGLRSFRGPDRPISFDLSLPEDTPSGEVQIVVGGGSTMDTIDRQVRQRQLAQVGELSDLLRLVREQRKNRDIYLRVARRSPSAIVGSEILPDLPLSIFSVLNNPRHSGDTALMLQAPVLELSRELDQVLVGGRRISIKVK